ncbi:MAG: hypothetical protein AAF741_09390 [Bacteroidota bacterium]
MKRFPLIFLLFLAFILPLHAQQTEMGDSVQVELNQDAYRVSLLTISPRVYRSGFVQRYVTDTLWLSAGISGRPASVISPFTAEQIINLKLPDGVKQKSNFFSGGLWGFGIGLLVGGVVVLGTDCDSQPGLVSATCKVTEVGALTVFPISGFLVGGLVSSLFFPKKEVTKYSTFSINGRPEALRAQRQRLQELSRWQR